MQLRLGSQAVNLQDGTGSWNGSAADALAIWNQYIDLVKFNWVSRPASQGVAEDGLNDVFFSNSIYGDTFGSNTLAVTVVWVDATDNSKMHECDVIFNSAKPFNSYRGPLQAAYDFHRVALHEFGHVLGLAHPDQNGQATYALMNSYISNFDSPLDDDIDGAQFLYEFKLTSLLPLPNTQAGGSFSYQISANNHPTSYSVSGLPAGFHINTATGLISGTSTQVGTFPVVITAHGPGGDASAATGVIIWSDASQAGVLVGTLPVKARSFVNDAQRGRVYARTNNNIAIIDVETLSIIQTLNIATTDISISADGSRLWMGMSKMTSDSAQPRSFVGSVDLDTFAVLPEFLVYSEPPNNIGYVREGANQQIYFTVLSHGLFKLDTATGTVSGPFPDAQDCNYWIEVSPDSKTLLLGDSSGSHPRLGRYNISGATPTLLQNTPATVGPVSHKFAASHDRTKVWADFPGWSGLQSDDRVFQGNDLAATPVRMRDSGFGPVTFTWDDLMACSTRETPDWQTYTYTSKINACDPASGTVLGHVTVPGRAEALLVDSTNRYLFFSEVGQYEPNLTRVYRALPGFVRPGSKSFANISTRAFVQTGDDVEIGGFIIQGDQPKKVVLRALGPSLVSYGLPGVPDPLLELHDSTGAVISTNDNWASNQQDVLDTGLAPGDPHEAVIVATLIPGAYTAILRGSNGAIGTALFELYDADPGKSKVANISTRANVGTGDNVMIGGFIVGGNQPATVVTRAIGPSLTQYGVVNVLVDPVLELHDSTGALVAQNDDWQSDQQQAISNTGLAPGDLRESATLATLTPGAYTAIVRGKNNTSGVALVEVYNLSH